MLIVRCPSSSAIKLNAIRKALENQWAGQSFELRGLPVELQARPDMQINAQPEGKEQTTKYARERLIQMCREHGNALGLDIGIESGAIGNLDVAVIVLRTASGEEVTVLSRGIPFPSGTLEEARRGGFKTTTAGDIIHKKFPNVPANNWHGYFPPGISRDAQIRTAIKEGLGKITTL